MNVKKKVMGNIPKCYAIAPLEYNDSKYILIAAEKQGPIEMYDLEGNYVDTVHDGRGGVMTMEQTPGSNGAFLATSLFFSPNDSAEAKLVYYKPNAEGSWDMNIVRDIPHLHRFGILERNGINYLIACSLKSNHAFREDWTCPGRVWVAPLPEDFSQFDEENQLEMQPLMSGLYRNHGFFKYRKDGFTSAFIGTDNGVFKFTPPAEKDGEWETEQIIDEATSDILVFDIDQDGEDELIVYAPFHGQELSIYKNLDGVYEKIYRYTEPLPFLHAIWATEIDGKPTAIVGHRQGKRQLLLVSCDNPETKSFKVDVIDQDVGPANAFSYDYNGKKYIVAANREIDEIALYELS